MKPLDIERADLVGYSLGAGVALRTAYQGTAGSRTTAPTMPIFEGENLEVDPPRRMVQSFRAL